jgi:hypothetical protein
VFRREAIVAEQPPSSDFANLVVAEFRPFKRGCLRGFLVIAVPPGLILHDFRLFEKANGARWVAPPYREFKMHDGSRGFKPGIEFTAAELEREFRRAALEALDRFLADTGDAA